MTLKPGDVCLILPGNGPRSERNGPDPVGKECTLVSREAIHPFIHRERWVQVSAPWWKVDLDGGTPHIVAEYRLQKKRPPGHEKADWDDMIDIYVPPHIKERALDDVLIDIEEEIEA